MKLQLTAVWGSPGSGKSLISVALGHRLTAMKQSVILISASKLTPMSRVFLPFQEDHPDYSLAKLLTSGVTPISIRQKIRLHPKNENLGFMALVSTDNALQYQGNWERSDISELLYFIQDRELADHVIIDCTCDLFGDNMTFHALENADHVIRVISPDNRGVAFLNSQELILKSGNFQAERHIGAINNAFDYSPAKQMAGDWGIRYVLPHCPEAYGKYLTGEPILKLYGKDGYSFETAIKALAREVCNFD